jgi:hypothetical protein
MKRVIVVLFCLFVLIIGCNSKASDNYIMITFKNTGGYCEISSDRKVVFCRFYSQGSIERFSYPASYTMNIYSSIEKKDLILSINFMETKKIIL